MLLLTRSNAMFPKCQLQTKRSLCTDSLRASSVKRSGGWAGKGRRACNYVSGIWIPPPIFPVARRRLSCQISTNQREAETSANINKHWKKRAKVNDVTTNVISANQHFPSTFSMPIFKFQRLSCKLSFLFPPAARAPRRACSQASVQTPPPLKHFFLRGGVRLYTG